MENFDWTTFTRKIAIKAKLSDIYAAWTKAPEIEKWFLSHAVYFDADKKRMDRERSVKKGCYYDWSWYLYDVVESGRIVEANGKDFLQFTFAENCLVDVKLTAQDDHVIVELTQKNIPQDSLSKRNIRLGCDAGWSFFLVNLKSVYEGGLDLRNKNTALKGMLND